MILPLFALFIRALVAPPYITLSPLHFSFGDSPNTTHAHRRAKGPAGLPDCLPWVLRAMILPLSAPLSVLLVAPPYILYRRRIFPYRIRINTPCTIIRDSDTQISCSPISEISSNYSFLLDSQNPLTLFWRDTQRQIFVVGTYLSFCYLYALPPK